MNKVDTRTWFSVVFQKKLLKTCFNKNREKVSLEEVYKSHGTLKLYDVQALVHAWGFCYYTLFTSWGPVTTVSIKMAAVSSQEQMTGDQNHFSLRCLHTNRYDDETDSYFGEDWFN